MSTVLWKTIPGTLLQDQLIPKTGGGYHPHLVDIYVPPVTTTRLLISLHGGGGSKEENALSIRATTTSTNITAANVNWSLLSYWHVVVVIPQGQHANGITSAWNPNGANTESASNPDGTATWSNHFMWSGADDVLFLQDLSDYLTAAYPGHGRNLCGVSNGGFMCNRAWYELPNKYERMLTISGCASDYYVAHPTLPATIRPFFSQIGYNDDVLGVLNGSAGRGSHFYSDIWIQNSQQISVAGVDYPNLGQWIGEFKQLQTRVNAYNTAHSLPPETVTVGDGVVTSVDIGTQTRWSYSGGKNVLQFLSYPDHSLLTHAQATKDRAISVWMNFIINS